MLSIVLFIVGLQGALSQPLFDGSVACDPARRPAQLTSTSFFTNLGYDGSTPYGPNLQCEYLLTSEDTEGQSFIQFSDFQLEDTAGCTGDRVEIYSGSNDQGTLLNTVCGNQATPFNLNGGTGDVFIKFISDGSNGAPGFSGQVFESGSNPCSGGVYLGTSSGSIQSPGFDVGGYPANQECDWNILVPDPSYTVNLTMTGCGLEDSCGSFDYLEFYDRQTNDLMLKQYGSCMSYPGVSYRNTGNNGVLVRFVSDVSVQEQGFRLNYELVQA